MSNQCKKRTRQFMQDLRTKGMHIVDLDKGISSESEFDNESPLGRALANIATRIISGTDDDVGMIVPASNSDAADYGTMISDIMSAETMYDLVEIAEYYRDMPGSEELAAVCAAALSQGRRLSLVG